MSTYQIEIDDSKIIEHVNRILSEIIRYELEKKYGETDRDVFRAAIKDLIYDHKDEIIEKVVNRAVAEITRKGMPKLMNKIMEVKDEAL